MKITRFTPYASPGKKNSTPFLYSSHPDGGCQGPGFCNCSPGWWITVSDGEVGLRVQFDSKEEYEILKTLDFHLGGD